MGVKQSTKKLYSIGEVSRICKDFQLDKVSKVVVGGRERTDSVLAGLREVRPDADLTTVRRRCFWFRWSSIISRWGSVWSRCRIWWKAVHINVWSEAF